MKKMIIPAILSVAALIIGTAAITKMTCDNSHEDECIRYQTTIDNLRLSESRLSKAVAERDKTIAAKTEDINLLVKELKYQQEQKEILSDVIVRMRTKPEAEKKLKERLPYGMTNSLRFMDYRELNVTTSDQYRLQQECDTGILEGIRIYNDGENDYYCVALGSAYGRDIGDTWHVTLVCGTEFDMILADFKDNGLSDFFGHPDTNYDRQPCTNVIEFVVDKDKIPSSIKSSGTFTVVGRYGGMHGDGGNICKIEYTGRVWE